MRPERTWLGLCALATLGCVAAGDAGSCGGALAAATGTAFEAAPFLFFARALGPRLGPFAFLAGCGCGRGRLPGALALPAIALCALAFGPLPTVARVAAGLALARFGVASNAADDADDPLADLETLAACAYLAALGAEALAPGTSHLPAAAAFACGLALGAVAPCATAGLALAAGFARASPAFAAGALCTAGLVSFATLAIFERDRGRPAWYGGRVATLLLAAALGWLASRGPSGLVSPRLLVPIGVCACALVVAFARGFGSRSRSRTNALVPALMLGALVAVPKPPIVRADATQLDDAFAGERLAFLGVAHADRRGGVTLTRFAITCCRLDATPVSVSLEHGVAVARGVEGRWVAASGTLIVATHGELVLRADRVEPVAAPADPFVYR